MQPNEGDKEYISPRRMRFLRGEVCHFSFMLILMSAGAFYWFWYMIDDSRRGVGAKLAIAAGMVIVLVVYSALLFQARGNVEVAERVANGYSIQKKDMC